MTFLAKAHSYDPGGVLRMSFNGQYFRVVIVCVGHRLPIFPAATTAPAAPAREIENEEAAVFIGLKDFMRGLVADRKSATRRGKQVEVNLSHAL